MCCFGACVSLILRGHTWRGSRSAGAAVHCAVSAPERAAAAAGDGAGSAAAGAWRGGGGGAAGHGGVRAVARAAGVSETTVRAGVFELEAGEDPLPDGRVRKPGGGRRAAEDLDPDLVPALLALVEPDERGDPMSPLRWTTK